MCVCLQVMSISQPDKFSAFRTMHGSTIKSQCDKRRVVRHYTLTQTKQVATVSSQHLVAVFHVTMVMLESPHECVSIQGPHPLKDATFPTPTHKFSHICLCAATKQLFGKVNRTTDQQQMISVIKII